MIFGDCNSNYPSLILNGSPIDYVPEWKYLGTTITSGNTLGFSARPDLTAFFRAANTITGALTNAHEHTLVNLIYCNCVPILTYACAVKVFSAQEMSNCNLAINNALRRVFGFSDWRSIRYLREAFGVESVYVLFKKAQDRFHASCRTHSNPVISYIFNLMYT